MTSTRSFSRPLLPVIDVSIEGQEEHRREVIDARLSRHTAPLAATRARKVVQAEMIVNRLKIISAPYTLLSNIIS